MGELKEQGEYLQSERERLEGELSLTCRKMQMLESVQRRAAAADMGGGSGQPRIHSPSGRLDVATSSWRVAQDFPRQWRPLAALCRATP